MKLLYVTNQICGPGGLERVLSIKAGFLAEKLNYEVHFLTINQSTQEIFYEFSPKIEFHDIEVDTGSINYIFQYFRGVRRVIEKVKPDVISVCDDGIKGFLIPRIIRKLCPIIIEKHASKKLRIKSDKENLLRILALKLYNGMLNIAARRFDRLVVLTQDNLNEWSGLKNLMVIPNPLPFGLEKTSTLENKKVLVVGNHGYQKGFDRLLKIWQMIISEMPDWKLEIYGKFDPEKRHVKQSLELGLMSSVSFFEPERNIQEKYAEASIYAMTSRSEGFGMVLIEAMACGVPCIAFNCPCGPKDIINDNVDGYLIKDGDLEEYRRKMILLMKDYSLRSELGKNAKKTAGKYLAENIVQQWDTLFKELVPVT